MKYKRTKPHLIPDWHVHTCYEGHDCQERWTVGHHLAESLRIIEIFKGMSLAENNYHFCDYQDAIDKAIHNLRKAWDKSK